MGGIAVHRQPGESDKAFLERFKKEVMRHLTPAEKIKAGFWRENYRKKGGPQQRIRKRIAAKKG